MVITGNVRRDCKQNLQKLLDKEWILYKIFCEVTYQKDECIRKLKRIGIKRFKKANSFSPMVKAEVAIQL